MADLQQLREVRVGLALNEPDMVVLKIAGAVTAELFSLSIADLGLLAKRLSDDYALLSASTARSADLPA